MNMHEYQEFAVSRITAELLAELGALGIRMRDADATPNYWCDDRGVWRKEVGRVAVTVAAQLIELWPRHALTANDLNVLRGAGVDAFYQRPTHAALWTRHTSKARGTYWDCTVNIEMSADDPFARVLRTAETHAARVDQAFRRNFAAAGEEAA